MCDKVRDIYSFTMVVDQLGKCKLKHILYIDPQNNPAYLSAD
jgi:hypothetical protein